MGRIEISRATERTLPDIARVHAESWRASHKPFCSPAFVAAHTAERQERFFRAEEAAGKAVYLLTDDGVPAGVVTVHENRIENLYVAPGLQGRGYGTRLLHFAMDACSGTPELTVLTNNARAIRMYEKNGFAFTGKRMDYPATGVSEAEMRWQGDACPARER